MSYEAWGTPPDPEPSYCPMCDQRSHDPECELGKMQARALEAERQNAELRAALKEAEDARTKALNALLWFYRRGEPMYGRLPFAEEAITLLRQMAPTPNGAGGQND
jgi:hypothetical protein